MSQAEKCFKCGQIPDDILMLACNHDLCLSCAAQVFANQKPSTKKEFICDLCSVVTELDSSSIYELEKLHIQISLNTTNRKNSQPELQHRLVQLSTQNLKQRTQPQQQSQLSDQRHYSQVKGDKENMRYPRNSVNNLSHRNFLKEQSQQNTTYPNQVSRQTCPDHPEEDVTYFCFDCQSKCICPECIIHGVHKTHEVKTTKKAYPIIKQIIEQIQEANQSIETVIGSQREEIDRRQNQKSNIIDSLKQQIKQEFQILYQELTFKEQELLNELSQVHLFKSQYEEFQMQNEITEQKLKLLSEKIQNHLDNKDETLLLNFYAGISQQQMPQTSTLPEHLELLINHVEIFKVLKDMKVKLEQIQLNVQEGKPQAPSPFKNEQIRYRESNQKPMTQNQQNEMLIHRSSENKKKYISLD